MRERMARAMHAAYVKRYTTKSIALLDWEHAGSGPQEAYFLYADAALSALETPGEGMVEAVADASDPWREGDEGARAVFVVMIRKAREDGK